MEIIAKYGYGDKAFTVINSKIYQVKIVGCDIHLAFDIPNIVYEIRYTDNGNKYFTKNKINERDLWISLEGLLNHIQESVEYYDDEQDIIPV